MQASLTVPPEADLISGDNPVYIGNMNRGESRTINWTLIFMACGVFNLDVNVSGYRQDTGVYVEKHGSSTVTVIDTVPPAISILSPQNTTYLTSNVSLIFTVNETTDWIGCSLDGQANVTITGNTTLIGLSNGAHLLKVYANDTCGNIGSDEIYFTTHPHDVAVTSVTMSATKVYMGQSLNMTVEVKNKGVWTETFNVTAYTDLNTTIIGDEITVGIQDTTLTSGNSSTFTFTWNTTGVEKGDYTTSAKATVVPGETETTDNTKVDGVVTILSLTHDIAIRDVVPSKTVVGQNYSLSIHVTAKNYGSFTETFNVTAYYNDTPMETKIVTNLTSGEETTVIFKWDTTGFAKGYYTISAYATSVPGETYTTDNNFTYGQVRVVTPGNVNGDEIVNMVDIYTELILRFMCVLGEPCYSANSDIYSDGIINMIDIYIAIIHFMEKEP